MKKIIIISLLISAIIVGGLLACNSKHNPVGRFEGMDPSLSAVAFEPSKPGTSSGTAIHTTDQIHALPGFRIYRWKALYKNF